MKLKLSWISFPMDCLTWSDNGYAHVTLRWADETEVDVEVRAPNRQVDPGLFAVARAVLVRLAAIDNIVQRQCAGECERSGLHSMHYESLLARIFIAEGEVTPHYWGAVVNTEWDEVFSLVEGVLRHDRSGTGKGSGEVVSIEVPSMK